MIGSVGLSPQESVAVDSELVMHDPQAPNDSDDPKDRGKLKLPGAVGNRDRRSVDIFVM